MVAFIFRKHKLEIISNTGIHLVMFCFRYQNYESQVENVNKRPSPNNRQVIKRLE